MKRNSNLGIAREFLNIRQSICLRTMSRYRQKIHKRWQKIAKHESPGKAVGSDVISTIMRATKSRRERHKTYIQAKKCEIKMAKSETYLRNSARSSETKPSYTEQRITKATARAKNNMWNRIKTDFVSSEDTISLWKFYIFQIATCGRRLTPIDM